MIIHSSSRRFSPWRNSSIDRYRFFRDVIIPIETAIQWRHDYSRISLNKPPVTWNQADGLSSECALRRTVRALWLPQVSESTDQRSRFIAVYSYAVYSCGRKRMITRFIFRFRVHYTCCGKNTCIIKTTWIFYNPRLHRTLSTIQTMTVIFNDDEKIHVRTMISEIQQKNCGQTVATYVICNTRKEGGLKPAENIIFSSVFMALMI